MAKGSYTIVGNPVKGARFSAVILYRGPYHPREKDIQQLLITGVQEIIIVVSRQSVYDTETLCRQFSFLQVLLYDSDMSVGELLNICMGELHAPYILVVWNGVRIKGLRFSSVERSFQESELIIAPRIYDSVGEIVPTRQTPCWERGKIGLRYNFAVKTKERGLFPYDYMGIYQRAGFQMLGGFDPDITLPFRQLFEFGIRLAMSSYSCMLLSDWQMMLKAEPPMDHNDSYYELWIYLKLFLPDWKVVRLPFRRIFRGMWYAWKRHVRLVTLVRLFLHARRWVFRYPPVAMRDAVTTITSLQDET